MPLAKDIRRFKIKMRIRKRISGTTEMPRLTVFRSNKQIYAQIIDDVNGKTLLGVSSLSKELGENKSINKVDQAKLVGQLVAKKAIEKNIAEVVFDRNGYLYHGRVKSLADAAREGGLKF